jgi:chemotaxis protein histidine kinase CheA
MAKGKDAKLAPKQSTLNSFFAAPKTKEPSSDFEMVTSDHPDDASEADSSTEEKKTKPSKSASKSKMASKNTKAGKKPKAKNSDDEDASDADSPITKQQSGKSIAYDLPPMHDLPTIFSDLVGHIPQIKKVAERIQGRKLRVATMCSGTESPLLALDLIRKSILEIHGLNFDVEHVFSCEIEPFKQAYIERNFRPPLLFRDVCELGSAEAYAIVSIISISAYRVFLWLELLLMVLRNQYLEMLTS